MYKKQSTIYILFAVLLLSSLIVLIPPFKYASPINIYGVWDSLAHYSFAKWIVYFGRIPSSGEVYYSYQYAYHAGNGVLPAFISIISGLSIDSSMNLSLIVGYWIYIIILYLITTRSLLCRPESQSRYLLTYFILSLPMFYPYYTGSSISFPFIAIIVYNILPYVTEIFPRVLLHKILLIIGFMGLLVTHFSTATVLTLVIVLSFGIKWLFDTLRAKKNNKAIYPPCLLLLTLYFAYELYLDVILFERTFTYSFFNVLTKLYVYEIEAAMQEKIYEMPLLDRIFNYIFMYVKETIMLVIVLFQTFFILYTMVRNLNQRREMDTVRFKITKFFTLMTLLSILFVWVSVGRILTSSIRFLNIVQFLTCIVFYNVIVLLIVNKKTYKHKYKMIGQVFLTVALICIISFNFICNYGLTIFLRPYRFEEKTVYVNLHNGALNSLVLLPVKFADNFIGKDVKFICMQPYIPYGYCDLMWNTSKIPSQGHITIGLKYEDAINVIDSILKNRGEYIFPLPLKEGVVPAYLEYESYYLKPFHYLLLKGGCLFYSNGFYSLIYIV